MVKFYEQIPDSHIAWIKKQHMFFVATAPLTGEHINVSPKGLDGTLHVDLSGSGIETISHIRENGRITVMFCAYEGPARILRLYGRGVAHEFGTPQYDALVPAAQRHPSSRAAIVIDVHKVSTSCGYAVPLYTFKAERSALTHWAEKMEKLDEAFPPRFVDADAAFDSGCPVPTVRLDTEAGARVYATGGMKEWWTVWNRRSHDGLEGLHSAYLSDVPLATGVAVHGAGEPPSDGSVVILGNQVPRVRGALAGRLKGGRELLLPGSGVEAARLVCVFVLGLVLATVYGQGLQRFVKGSLVAV